MTRQFHGGVRWPGAVIRSCRAILLVVLTVAGITSAARADNWPDVQSMLNAKEFQEALRLSKWKLNAAETRIAYLVLNHETLEWSVYHSEPPKNEKTSGGATSVAIATKGEKEPVLGSDGNPHIMRSGKEKLVLIVWKTNPFLYSYEGTVSPPQESPDAAAMRSALSAIGSAISGLLTLKEPSGTPAQTRLQEYEKNRKPLLDLVEVQERLRTYVQDLETGAGGKSNVPPARDALKNTAKNGLEALNSLENSAQSW